MQTAPLSRPRRRGRIRAVALVATAVLLVGGFVIALMPALVFHSGLSTVYGRYPTFGMFVGLFSLVPANVWAVSVLRPRMSGALLVVMLIVLTATAAAILFLAFIYIYLSTIDWFVF